MLQVNDNLRFKPHSAVRVCVCVCSKTPIISRDSVRNVLTWRFLLKEEEDEKEEDYVKSNCGQMPGFEEILNQPLKSVAAACLAVSHNNLLAVTKDFIFCLCSVLLFYFCSFFDCCW